MINGKPAQIWDMGEQTHLIYANRRIPLEQSMTGKRQCLPFRRDRICKVNAIAFVGGSSPNAETSRIRVRVVVFAISKLLERILVAASCLSAPV
jgi:hypothetical protein